MTGDEKVAAKQTVARRKAIGAREEFLSRHAFPRLTVAVLAALTGLAGFLASWCLLHLGLRTMGIRYALSVAIAYAVFLLLVRLWLRAARAAIERDGSAFGTPEPEEELRPSPGTEGGQKTPWSLGFYILDGLLDILDLKALLLLGVLFLGVAGLVAAIMVVLSAPVLLAEVLLGGFLSAGLYRRLRASPGEGWLGIAVRRTWKPFLLALIFFAAAGIVLQAIAPRAASIGAAFKEIFR